MATIRELRFFILQLADATQERGIRPYETASELKVDEAHVREELVYLAKTDHITLTGFDGKSRKPWDQWSSEEAFFNSGFDSHTKWIKVRSKGKALLEDMKSETEPEPEPPKSKIGFI